jgi:DNA polymerase III epsilon subunit-like protein
MEYNIFIADTETTGLDNRLHDIIEISILNFKTEEQKTWFLQPLNIASADPGALKVNGHKLEDLKLQTKFGKDTYRKPNEVLVEIENWIMDSNVPTQNIVLCGQNVKFDLDFLEQLWIKCESKDSFPFGRRFLDTSQIEFMMDTCKNSYSEAYSLNAICKKYNVKNQNAHSSESDVKATFEVFKEQIKYLSSKLK